MKRIKKLVADLEKMCTNHIPDKRLISKIQKYLKIQQKDISKNIKIRTFENHLRNTRKKTDKNSQHFSNTRN